MARPTKEKKELKSFNLNVWMTDQEYNLIKKLAKKASMSSSSFLLYAGLNKTIYAPAPLLNIKAFGQLANIGNNLNQLTKKANMAGLDDILYQSTSELVNELIQVLVQIKTSNDDK
jgi:hypothetical protein